MSKPEHYDNSRGSLYKITTDLGCNNYEFDIIKRVVRCRHKGNFIEDIDKTIFLLELYKEEHLKSSGDAIGLAVANAQ